MKLFNWLFRREKQEPKKKLYNVTCDFLLCAEVEASNADEARELAEELMVMAEIDYQSGIELFGMSEVKELRLAHKYDLPSARPLITIEDSHDRLKP